VAAEQDVVGDISGALWVVMGTIGIVLLIACANVANLLLVRAECVSEAVRAALGAGWRLLREWLLEIALTSLSGVLGIGLTIAILRLLVAIGPASLPGSTRSPSTPSCSCSPCCLRPVWPAVRRDPLAPARGTECDAGCSEVPAARRPTAATGTGRGRLSSLRSRLRSCCSSDRADDPQLSRLPRSMRALRARIASSWCVAIPETQIENPERVVRMQSAIRDAVAASGVSAVAFTSSAPMELFNSNDVLVVEGRPTRKASLPIRRFKFVSPGFFQTLTSG
jgi:hypothetical protein